MASSLDSEMFENSLEHKIQKKQLKEPTANELEQMLLESELREKGNTSLSSAYGSIAAPPRTKGPLRTGGNSAPGQAGGANLCYTGKNYSLSDQTPSDTPPCSFPIYGTPLESMASTLDSEMFEDSLEHEIQKKELKLELTVNELEQMLLELELREKGNKSLSCAYGSIAAPPRTKGPLRTWGKSAPGQAGGANICYTDKNYSLSDQTPSDTPSCSFPIYGTPASSVPVATSPTIGNSGGYSGDLPANTNLKAENLEDLFERLDIITDILEIKTDNMEIVGELSTQGDVNTGEMHAVM